jgi:hypothetical protein
VVALLVIVGVVGFIVAGGYQVDQGTYSKAVFAPKEQQVALVEKRFTPLPKAEPVAIAADADSGSSKKSKRSRKRSKAKPKSKRKPISSKPKQSKANERANALEDALNTDIFGGGL